MDALLLFPSIFCFIKCNVNMNSEHEHDVASNSCDSCVFSLHHRCQWRRCRVVASSHTHTLTCITVVWRNICLALFIYHHKYILVIKWSYFRHKFKAFMCVHVSNRSLYATIMNSISYFFSEHSLASSVAASSRSSSNNSDNVNS